MDIGINIDSHRYGELLVLEDIRIDVQSGQIVCIVGPSGCGKSTLLGIVGGLIKATKGEVLLNGEPAADCLNPLTYVFQDFALLPWRTVEKNIEFVLDSSPLSSSEKAARITSVLERTGLSEFREAFPKQLSGGMRQRVGIARALAVRPAVLLLDEPFSALDAQTRELLMEDFLDLWLRDKTTSLYVTHNLDEAIKLADKVIVLSRRPGRIKEIIEIAIPQRDRVKPEHSMEISRLQTNLWSLIRDEARDASLEVSHV